MLRTIALGAEFLGNGLAAVALLRLAFHKVTHNCSREWLFAALLSAMAAFCTTNIGYAIIASFPDNPYVGWGTAFEATAETLQVLTFLYLAPVLLTIIALTNILHRRGFKFISRKVGVS